MLKQWCEQNGIKLEYTAPHSPEQNGVAERMNRTLAELTCAMMFGTSVPVHLWPEAMRHTAYLRNRTHTWALEGQTPLEWWSGTRPNVAHLHEFGGPIWILNEGPNWYPKARNIPSWDTKMAQRLSVTTMCGPGKSECRGTSASSICQ